MKPSALSDDELIYLIHRHQEEALQLMLRKYEPLIGSLVHQIVKGQGKKEIDEMKQAGKLAILSAIDNYRDDKECGFHHFMRICMERVLHCMHRQQVRRQRHYVTDYPTNGMVMEAQDAIYWPEIAANTHPSFDPRWAYYYNEYTRRADQCIQSLSAQEQAVYALYQSGCSYRTIAGELGIKEKTVDNRLQKIRRKITALFD